MRLHAQVWHAHVTGRRPHVRAAHHAPPWRAKRHGPRRHARHARLGRVAVPGHGHAGGRPHHAGRRRRPHHALHAAVRRGPRRCPGRAPWPGWHVAWHAWRRHAVGEGRHHVRGRHHAGRAHHHRVGVAAHHARHAHARRHAWRLGRRQEARGRLQVGLHRQRRHLRHEPLHGRHVRQRRHQVVAVAQQQLRVLHHLALRHVGLEGGQDDLVLVHQRAHQARGRGARHAAGRRHRDGRGQRLRGHAGVGEAALWRRQHGRAVVVARVVC
mmetsp:Transcript_34136/g.86356  ORF Transcript_34136/g.86356 Transcript_34136/m.86356 type:complete len:269 (+) Transcript_34136:1269-2075(+)